MPNEKTPEEDFRRFEKWIDDMPDLEFEEKLEIPESEGGFSDKQKRLFSEMRETLDEDKIEILEERGFDIGYEDAPKERRDALRRFRIE